MYKSRELESVFIEIINGGKNEIFGCIYRHPVMSIDYFTKNIFNDFIDKLSNENKVFYLSGDFDIDLLKIESDKNIENFYNHMTSHLFVPQECLHNQGWIQSRLESGIPVSQPNLYDAQTQNCAQTDAQIH